MSPKPGYIGSIAAWIVALSLVLFAAYLGWQMVPGKATVPVQNASAETIAFLEEPLDPMVSLPKYTHAKYSHALVRKVVPRTVIPSRPSLEVKSYTVELGDSVFEIASNFKIKPETLLWANYDQLNDNPDMVSIGMSLNIPPIDGVYYQWQDGDTVQSIATRFEAKIDDILNWSGNNLDLTEPTKSTGEWVMVPGGHREFRQWIIPVIPRGAAGVSKSVYGAGACEGGYEGAFGSGGFIWPAGNHSLSGNDYWSGHLGIDIAAGEGAPIYAADSGVVVFSGWATGGYGNMVMVDHGNGYQSVYAHLSNASASCGRSVGQGQIIGYSGSTGNSTGAHLHFEVRYLGGFVSPWYVLPAP